MILFYFLICVFLFRIFLHTVQVNFPTFDSIKKYPKGHSFSLKCILLDLLFSFLYFILLINYFIFYFNRLFIRLYTSKRILFFFLFVQFCCICTDNKDIQFNKVTENTQILNIFKTFCTGAIHFKNTPLFGVEFNQYL